MVWVTTRSLCRFVNLVALVTLLVHVHSSEGSYFQEGHRDGLVTLTGLGYYEGKGAPPQLAESLYEQEATYHWVPWHPVRTKLEDDKVIERNCSGNSIDEFPKDLFSEYALKHGAIILHFLGGMYSFTFLAVVCNDYFIPAVECICDDLNLTKDVAAATFMASATSCPELFVNIMATFVTKNDLGIGTIVGSAMFNALGVTAIGGLAAVAPIKIKKWPVVRECLVYCLMVALLVGVSWDGRIEWYEAMVFPIIYILYFIFMFNNKRVIKFFVNHFRKNDGKRGFNVKNVDKGTENPAFEKDENPKFVQTRMSVAMSHGNGKAIDVKDVLEKNLEADEKDSEVSEKIRKSLWRYPSEKSLNRKIWFIYTWPLKLILTCTIPSPKTFRSLYPLTFIMCIFWIAGNSYFVSWMITVIGFTFSIPDTIMGMTFLAFGGCLPEACSIFIMSRRGEGEMGVSNSLGANSLAILFSLGIPWFIKTMVLKGQGLDPVINIESGGIDYIILSLIPAIGMLYLVLYLMKFNLRKSTGAIIFAIYLVFIAVAIMMESGVFFDVGLPEC